MMLCNLGNSLGRLFEQTGGVEVLTEAVTVVRQALAVTSIDHPNRASYPYSRVLPATTV